MVTKFEDSSGELWFEQHKDDHWAHIWIRIQIKQEFDSLLLPTTYDGESDIEFNQKIEVGSLK